MASQKQAPICLDSYCWPHLSSPTAQTEASTVLPWPAGEQQVWCNSCLLCLHCVCPQNRKKDNIVGFLYSKEHFKIKKTEISKPSKGNVQVSCCVGNLSWRHGPCIPWCSKNPETDFWKDLSAALHLQLRPECFLSDRVTPQGMADPRPLLALRHMPASRN